MTLSKVVRKGSYQGVAQWGINTSSEITPSRKTAQKWAELENAHNKQVKPTYEVIVGNIGRVHTGNNPTDANDVYDEYVRQSKTGSGRAANESVYLMEDDQPIAEHQGPADDDAGLEFEDALYLNKGKIARA